MNDLTKAQLATLMNIFNTNRFFHWYCEDGGAFNEYVQNDVEGYVKALEEFKKMWKTHSRG